MANISSPDNNRFKQWKLMVERPKKVETHFLVEGVHLVEEALKSGAVEEIILTENAAVPTEWGALDGVVVHEISSPLGKALAETETSQGVFAVCRKNQDTPSDYDQMRFILAIDAIQDPGNLGTIIRTADAMGVEAILLGSGCVDLYNQKTIRATQGSLFHLPITQVNLLEVLPHLKTIGVQVIGTSLKNAVPLPAFKRPERLVLVIGNEGRGVAAEILEMADTNIAIPMSGAAESLNAAVAAGILLYALK